MSTFLNYYLIVNNNMLIYALKQYLIYNNIRYKSIYEQF